MSEPVSEDDDYDDVRQKRMWNRSREQNAYFNETDNDKTDTENANAADVVDCGHFVVLLDSYEQDEMNEHEENDKHDEQSEDTDVDTGTDDEHDDKDEPV